MLVFKRVVNEYVHFVINDILILKLPNLFYGSTSVPMLQSLSLYELLGLLVYFNVANMTKDSQLFLFHHSFNFMPNYSITVSFRFFTSLSSFCYKNLIWAAVTLRT